MVNLGPLSKKQYIVGNGLTFKESRLLYLEKEINDLKSANIFTFIFLFMSVVALIVSVVIYFPLAIIANTIFVFCFVAMCKKENGNIKNKIKEKKRISSEQ